MSKSNWRRVEELFHQALEFSPAARGPFLDNACGSNAELRRQVELLLSKDREAETFLENPAFETHQAMNAAAPVVGGQFGRYRILALLGAGGMGEVYRAHDSQLGRDIAIKTLPVEFARDPARLTRFRREARALAALNHPNIAAIYGLEQTADTDGLVKEYLVLELVEGDGLRGPLPIAAALDCADQVAAALEAAHAKGIIHRDLKPANIKITPTGRVKVLDFGLAKAILGSEPRRDLSQLENVGAAQTLAGHIVGTPGYMSPEQARGLDVDQRADIWAFGCLLYELVTGERSFQGDSVHETIAAVLAREPNWSALPPNAPALLRKLLRQCLEKDPVRRLSSISDARRVIQQARRGKHRWAIAVAAAIVVGAATTAGALWLRPLRPLDRSAWEQLTNLTDSAAQPALSPDGRMLAFVRGPATFVSPGQVYIKALPNGELVPLTYDNLPKMSPVFSPDGTRIAYTARTPAFSWDTWVVPVSGGESQPWLRNASGLIWTGPHQLLFSKIKEGLHMGIVTDTDNRLGARDVYLPANERGMAHRSYLSPDGKWVLLVEMDKDGLWGPCRVVPFDGSSPGRQVGPAGADCTFGAWSNDGKWIYVTSKAGGFHHIWRQRFPAGTPEQITSGTTEEEGLAMAPDGRSLVTAVAMQTGAIWVHDANGERQVSLEGNAAYPKFTPDGKKLCYLVLKSVVQPGTNRDPGEIWVADLESGRSEPVVPGVHAFSFDISQNGRQIVMEVLDKEDKPRLWLASLDGSSAPRQIPNVEGRECLFGPGGDILFRKTEGASGFLYLVHPDGTGLEKALDRPILILFDISPDKRWIFAWAALETNQGSISQAIPLDGAPAVRLEGIGLKWAPDGRSVALGTPQGSFIFDLPPGQDLPKIPAAGILDEKSVLALAGGRRVRETRVSPGPSPDVYAFSRGAVHRNLYRIPIP